MLWGLGIGDWGLAEAATMERADSLAKEVMAMVRG